MWKEIIKNFHPRLTCDGEFSMWCYNIQQSGIHQNARDIMQFIKMPIAQSRGSFNKIPKWNSAKHHVQCDTQQKSNLTSKHYYAYCHYGDCHSA